MFDNNSVRTVFEKQISELFSKSPRDGKAKLLQILSIIFYQNPNAEDLSILYELLGLDLLSKLINFADGRTIKLPTRAEFEDMMVLAVCYNYRELDGLKWEEVKEKLSFPISSLTFSKRIKKINQGLKKELNRLFEELKEEKDNV
jgi:hypothetical protein